MMLLLKRYGQPLAIALLFALIMHYSTDTARTAAVYLCIGLVAISSKIAYQFFKQFAAKAKDSQTRAFLPHLNRLLSYVTVSIILIGFVYINDAQHLLFNGYLGLSWLTVIYAGSLFIHQNKQLLKKNSFIGRYRKIIFYSAAFSFLLVGINTTTDHGIFSTKNQFILMFFLLLFYAVFNWFFEKWKLIQQLKNEKSTAELMHLQSQVNPHFFFNTLNNLYGLMRRKPDEAQQMVLKLSDMMRYSIYQGQKEWVSIQEEIDYLINYIELHQLRYHKDIDIQFHPVFMDNVQLRPLLFIILLENAFKHGVENLTEDAFVHMELHANQEQVHFKIRNNYDISTVRETNGIGLVNLQKRLALLYPQKHRLLFQNEGRIFEVTLELQLS